MGMKTQKQTISKYDIGREEEIVIQAKMEMLRILIAYYRNVLKDAIGRGRTFPHERAAEELKIKMYRELAELHCQLYDKTAISGNT